MKLQAEAEYKRRKSDPRAKSEALAEFTEPAPLDRHRQLPLLYRRLHSPRHLLRVPF